MTTNFYMQYPLSRTTAMDVSPDQRLSRSASTQPFVRPTVRFAESTVCINPASTRAAGVSEGALTPSSPIHRGEASLASQRPTQLGGPLLRTSEGDIPLLKTVGHVPRISSESSDQSCPDKRFTTLDPGAGELRLRSSLPRAPSGRCEKRCVSYPGPVKMTPSPTQNPHGVTNCREPDSYSEMRRHTPDWQPDKVRWDILLEGLINTIDRILNREHVLAKWHNNSRTIDETLVRDLSTLASNSYDILEFLNRAHDWVSEKLQIWEELCGLKLEIENKWISLKQIDTQIKNRVSFQGNAEAIILSTLFNSCKHIRKAVFSIDSLLAGIHDGLSFKHNSRHIPIVRSQNPSVIAHEVDPAWSTQLANRHEIFPDYRETIDFVDLRSLLQIYSAQLHSHNALVREVVEEFIRCIQPDLQTKGGHIMSAMPLPEVLVANAKFLLRCSSQIVHLAANLCSALGYCRQPSGPSTVSIAELRSSVETSGNAVCEALKGLIAQTKEVAKQLTPAHSSVGKHFEGQISSPEIQRFIGTIQRVASTTGRIKAIINKAATAATLNKG